VVSGLRAGVCANAAATAGADEASARGGMVRVRPRGERVLIAGKAVTILKGELID
jgi:hypothetical protein